MQHYVSFLYELGVRSSYQESPRDWQMSPLTLLSLASGLKKQDVPPPSLRSLNLPSPSLNENEKDLIMAKNKASLVPHSHFAYECKTLDELKKSLENFDACDLKTTANSTVFSDGNIESEIMFIGEAPGAEEDAKGIPFVGRAGQLLDKMLSAIQLDRSNVYITNIVPWRPPSNRTPSNDEVSLFLPFVLQHIHLKKPKYLILLGGVATKAILDSTEGITRLRGRWHDYQLPSCVDADKSLIKVLPLFHPAFLLRFPSQKMYAWEDLKLLRKTLDDPKAA